MWIVRLALRRPYTIAVLSILLMLFGVMSAQRMRKDIFPTIDIPVVIVVWNYPGLSADEMEKRVVFLSERAYSTTVNGISRIESQSMSGIGILKVYFDQGADIGGAIAQIGAVSLTASRAMPPGITPPAVVQFNASNVPVAQMTLSSKTMSEQQIFDYGLQFLRLQLFTVPGLSTPAPYGGKQRQIMVDLDLQAASARGLAPQDVVSALLQSNIITPAGETRIGGTDYDVSVNNSPPTIAEFNKIPIKVSNGAMVLLGDVATVHDGFAVQNNIVRVDGHRATYLAILKKASASTLAVVDAARDMLPAIREAAKANGAEALDVRLDFDQSVFVRASISGVLREAIISAILVSLMVLAFLGSWRSVVIVSTSIPLAIAVGLIGLFLLDQTLNAMTLGGLSLAIGMLVDDATVEIENIHRNRSLGKKLTVAILDGASQIATPALAATTVICIVFFPVVLLTGPARYLFTALALSVVISMMASYLLSRTLVPALSRKLMASERHDPRGTPPRGLWGRFNHARDAGFERLQNFYARILDVVLAHRPFVLLCAGVVVGAAIALASVVGTDFFPSVDAGQMRLHVRAPLGTRIEDTEMLVADVEHRIRQIIPADELATINDNIGIPLSYNLAFVQSDNLGGGDADVLIALKGEHGPTRGYEQKIRAMVNKEFPGATFYFQPADIVTQVLNFGLPAPINVEVVGRNVEASAKVARELREKIRLIPGAVDVHIAQVLAHPALRIDVDRERAAQVGVTQRDVANDVLVSLASSTLVAPSFWLSPQTGVNYPVVVQTPISQMSSVDAIMSTPITPSGAPGTTVANSFSATPGVAPTLADVATIAPYETAELLSHDAVQRVVEIRLGVDGRDLGGVSADIDAAIASLGTLPPATTINVRGQTESMRSSFHSLGVGVILATILVYLLLVVLFQSFIDPFIIIVAVPGALTGVLIMLALTHTTINVESLMGTIMSIGVATSNSILLVSFANEIRETPQGAQLTALQAAREAGRTRLRPVLMTALAMVLGMIPMAIGSGEGGEQNAPLARAVIGGLSFATFVTLFVVPVVYSLLRRQAPAGLELDRRFAAESTPSPDGSEDSEEAHVH